MSHIRSHAASYLADQYILQRHVLPTQASQQRGSRQSADKKRAVRITLNELLPIGPIDALFLSEEVFARS